VGREACAEGVGATCCRFSTARLRATVRQGQTVRDYVSGLHSSQWRWTDAQSPSDDCGRHARTFTLHVSSQCGECGLRQGNIRRSVQAPSYGHARSAPIRLHQLPRTQPGEPLTAPPHWGLGRVRKASVPLASASRLRATVRQGQTVRDCVVVQVCTHRNGTGQMRSLCQMTASAMQMYSSFTSAPNAASAG